MCHPLHGIVLHNNLSMRLSSPHHPSTHPLTTHTGNINAVIRWSLLAPPFPLHPSLLSDSLRRFFYPLNKPKENWKLKEHTRRHYHFYGSTCRFTQLGSICRDCRTFSFFHTVLPTVQDSFSDQSSSYFSILFFSPLLYTPLFSISLYSSFLHFSILHTSPLPCSRLHSTSIRTPFLFFSLCFTYPHLFLLHSSRLVYSPLFSISSSSTPLLFSILLHFCISQCSPFL